MASYTCPHCDGVSHPFGSHKSVLETEFNTPYLGSIPLDHALHNASENHKPICPKTQSGMASHFEKIAMAITADIQKSEK